ncbi:tyrosine-type recombinase/integrase [Aeromicrobium sp.]|uniref:tyrosine-type recombinase/integrase n=1 Tax=Aeromicrobium sp. TaxID=1871063 RepID=UPI004033500F
MATINSYSTKGGKRYRVRYRTPDRRQTDKKGFRTKRDAEAFAATIEVAKLTGDYIDPSRSRVTVTDLAVPWLESRTHLKPSTRRTEESAWRVHVEPRWGRTPISRIEHSDVKTWLAQLTNSGKSPTTVKRAHGLLSAILADAVLDRRLSRNPCAGVPTPRKTSKEQVFLNHEELHRLARESGEHANLVFVLGYCGLRWGEVVGLRVRDFNPLKQRLTINRNAVEVGTVIEVGTPKTHERRDVPVPAFLAVRLRLATEGRDPELPLFPAPDGGILRRTRTDASAGGWFAGAVRRAGVPRVTPHDLRHTAASLAIAAGANVKSVQRMLGHKSAAMTLDVYSGLFDDDLEAVAVALNEAALRATATSNVSPFR